MELEEKGKGGGIESFCFGVNVIDMAKSDRGGARTHDQRINLPHRLSPTASNLWVTPPILHVDGLDSLTAISGVPRRVSEAGATDPVVPCLLIAQSPALFLPSRWPLPAALWRRGLSGCPSILRHAHPSVGVLPEGGSYSRAERPGAEVRCSTD